MRQEISAEANKKFIFETTADESPTVRIVSEPVTSSAEGDLSEAMHSLKGAFSETVYIYGTAIETALTKGFQPSVLSMGLGLGYVELLAAGLFLKNGVLPHAGGVSFEIIPELRAWFQSWLAGDSAALPAEFHRTYDEIARRTAVHLAVDADEIRSALAGLVREKRWRIEEALTTRTVFQVRFGCICFDAFSSKTTPDLWTEEFLKNFLAAAADERCVLSTYACTGALKRALRDAGFSLDIRMGFASKRDSTFAVRGG